LEFLAVDGQDRDVLAVELGHEGGVVRILVVAQRQAEGLALVRAPEEQAFLVDGQFDLVGREPFLEFGDVLFWIRMPSAGSMAWTSSLKNAARAN
jgi:hypothetical protein